MGGESFVFCSYEESNCSLFVPWGQLLAPDLGGRDLKLGVAISIRPK